MIDEGKSRKSIRATGTEMHRFHFRVEDLDGQSDKNTVTDHDDEQQSDDT